MFNLKPIERRSIALAKNLSIGERENGASGAVIWPGSKTICDLILVADLNEKFAFQALGNGAANSLRFS
jgi:hypothetical protein